VTYDEKIEHLLRTGEPFRDAQAFGYQTDGGSYIIGSSCTANDDGEDHDLAVVTSYGSVHQLRWNAYTAPIVLVVNRLRDEVGREAWEEELLDENQGASEQETPWYSQPD
jgi:hypothetical protein